ncbi:hypothetical protein LINPERHAP2_LOCUS408, partial [Linum perenne]
NKNPFLSTFQLLSPHLQCTTLEQGATQSRGAWIEVHNLGRGACKRRIVMVFLNKLHSLLTPMNLIWT